MDVCLIPEVPFKLHGDSGLLSYVESVIAHKGHAVVCVAEGAGQVRHAMGVTAARHAVTAPSFSHLY